MTNLDDLRAYIQGNLTTVLAYALIALIGIGLLMFAATNVLPAWRAHSELSAQVASAQDALQQQQESGQGSGDILRAQLESMQSRVGDQAAVFLTDKQAAQVLANLYDYARESGAVVIDLEAQAAPKENTNKKKAEPTSQAPPAFTAHVFRLTVAGEPEQLLGFLTRFKEAAQPGVSLSNLKIEDKDGSTNLVVDLTMYTSPFAKEDELSAGLDVTPLPLPPTEMLTATPELPTPTPELLTPGATASAAALTPTTAQTQASGPAAAQPGSATATTSTAPAATLASLQSQLDTEWQAENWPAIITISQQILALDPTAAGLSVKLYTAHTNYGYQLASQGRTEEARAEFNAALAINPDGAAALAGLKMLASGNATPAPAVRIYVVQWGDTLANLALHFGTSVNALKAANHLLDDRIYAGQELIIPQYGDIHIL